ncbi:MAG: tyrosine-type recombinase/integrase [Hespellia sp.]|nr:tyrosine-type recombinase/integrase [Hespellia sp.]
MLLQRTGLSSTEIGNLKPKDLAVYDNDAYFMISTRETPCFVPEDAFAILLSYMEQRQDKEYLFYNSRGNRLNTMYFSRMMKIYTQMADIPSYSAESLRSTCGVIMYAYGADSKQVTLQMAD